MNINRYVKVGALVCAIGLVAQAVFATPFWANDQRFVYMPMLQAPPNITATSTPITATPSPTSTRSPSTPTATATKPPSTSGSISAMSVDWDNDCTASPANTGTVPATLLYGVEIVRLWVIASNYGGAIYRAEIWYNNVLNEALSDEGIVVSDEMLIELSVVLVDDLGVCAGALPRGNYEMRVYINDVLLRQGSIKIQ
jgi:hypothetical protein